MPAFEWLTEDGSRVYACRTCHAHLAKEAHLKSVNFHALSGDAYLFSAVCNVRRGALLEKTMTTGAHTTADIACCGCGTVVGWYYHEAVERAQFYKEGMYILELARILPLRDDEEAEEDAGV